MVVVAPPTPPLTSGNAVETAPAHLLAGLRDNIAATLLECQPGTGATLSGGYRDLTGNTRCQPRSARSRVTTRQPRP